MNMRKMMFWKQADETAAAAHDANHGGGHAAGADISATTAPDPWSDAKVTALHQPSSIDVPADEQASNEFGKSPGQVIQVRGLMNAPELETFFKINQFGFGRHHGSKYRTHEALDRGLLAVITNFQNIVSDLAERRQVRMNRLQQTRQEVATLSPAMAETLRLACEQTQREIAVLNAQHDLAEKRKGWVLDALNRYQLGFDRGVRDALDFELLNA